MRKTSLSALALSFGLVLPSLVPAQTQSNPFFGGGVPTSGGGGSSISDLKFKSNSKIKLDFRNANIDMVISMFQKASGISIVKDPALVGPITLTSATAVPLKTAFQIFEKTLGLKGFDMRNEGGLVVIAKRNDRGGRGNEGMAGQMPIMDPSIFNPPAPVLKIYPIKYANATQVARVVNEVFISSGQSQNPFQALFGGGGGAMRFGGGGGGNQFGRGNQGRPQFSFGGFGGNQQGSSVRASADDYSNSVIVNAPDKEQKEVERVIRTIDKETDTPQTTKVYTLKYASASEVSSTVQNVLTNNAPRGKGGVTSSGNNFQDRFQQAIRFGSSQASFGTVAADARTNSLVVTATEESQLIVANVIKDLDRDIPLESTTFVIPLNNAKADDVANLLNQSFGQRQGANRNRAGGTGTQNRNTGTNGQRANGGGGGGGGGNAFGGLRGAVENPDDPNNLYLQMQDGQQAIDGELMTSVAAQGGGFFGQFGGGAGGAANRQNSTTTTQGRNAQGQIVPVRDLTGQITAIPDPNTNSIIVVANPEYAAIIRQILEQLDKIPEQVMIETIIVEANLDSTNKLGVEWNYADGGHLGTSGQTGNIGTNFGINTATNPAQGLKYTIGGRKLTSLLNAIQTDQKFNILSTPRIFTSNNTQAQINISQSIPYVVSSRTDNNGNLLYNYDFQDVGIVLTVTPRITANGYVTMDINQTANDLQGYTSFNAPIVNQREADTVVSVKNGETIILGGIIRNSVTATTNKIPILGDIPILGQLFKSSSKESHRTELLVLLTPRIVRDDMEARDITDQTKKQLSPESQKELGKVLPPESTKTEIKEKSGGGK